MVNDRDVEHILFLTEGRLLRGPLQLSQTRHKKNMYSAATSYLQKWIKDGVPEEIWEKLEVTFKRRFFLNCAPRQPVTIISCFKRFHIRAKLQFLILILREEPPLLMKRKNK